MQKSKDRNNICLQLKQCIIRYCISIQTSEFYDSKRQLRKRISHLDSAWKITQTEKKLCVI